MRGRGRTWSLGELDLAETYRLWFDVETRRWEVRPIMAISGRLVTPGRTTDGRPADRPRSRDGRSSLERSSQPVAEVPGQGHGELKIREAPWAPVDG
jgi:hypothetical protein